MSVTWIGLWWESIAVHWEWSFEIDRCAIWCCGVDHTARNCWSAWGTWLMVGVISNSRRPNETSEWVQYRARRRFNYSHDVWEGIHSCCRTEANCTARRREGAIYCREGHSHSIDANFDATGWARASSECHSCRRRSRVCRNDCQSYREGRWRADQNSKYGSQQGRMLPKPDTINIRSPKLSPGSRVWCMSLAGPQESKGMARIRQTCCCMLVDLRARSVILTLKYIIASQALPNK